MKRGIILNTALILALGFLALSCSDDDNFEPDNSAVKNAFATKYPGASVDEWEMKFNYYVANFRLDNNETEAWFESNANWVFTETDLTYAKLPDAIKTSFEASEYKNWEKDDIDKIERPETETVYILEVESGNTELDLYYSEDGELMKTENNPENTDRIPAVLSATILSDIDARYPGATVADVETEENNTLEVLINDNGTYREIYFDNTGTWLQTTTDIQLNSVPATVMNALSNSQYADYEIDDVEMLEITEGSFYLFELEKNDTEIDVKISPEGEVSLL